MIYAQLSITTTATPTETDVRTVSLQSTHLLVNFQVLNTCILFNIDPFHTKLENFPNFNVHFMTMWSCVIYFFNIQTHAHLPSSV